MQPEQSPADDQLDQLDQAEETGEPEELETTGEDAVLARREWLELFFDLVVVAAVAVLAHSMTQVVSSASAEGEHTLAPAAGVGVFVVLYTSVWFAWLTVVMYADVARGLTRTRTMTLAMFGVAVMAASNPLHNPERANAFAIAFILIRFMVARGSLATGRLLSSWSGLQSGGALIVWIISIWIPTPAKFAVWAAAITVDLLLTLVRDGYGEDDVQATRDHMLRRLQRRGPFGGSEQERHPRRPKARRNIETANARGTNPHRAEQIKRIESMSVTTMDAEHVTERLGLFLIIVLGEVVSQIVLSAAEQSWSQAFIITALAGFVTVVLLWFKIFGSGMRPASEHQDNPLQVRLALPLHLIGTLGIVVFAAGLGLAMEEADGHLPAAAQALICTGLVLYLLAASAVDALRQARWSTVLQVGAPAAVLAALAIVAMIHGEASGSASVLTWVATGCLFVATFPWRQPRPAAVA